MREEVERVLKLNHALDRLAQTNPRLVQVVECRCFAGYTEAETATTLSLSLRTVQRDWMEAKKMLQNELSGS